MQLDEQPGSGSERMLSVNGVTKKYGKFVALNNISLDVAKGKHLLILGPNGAGKSTLIKCIMDLISFHGSIRVRDIDVKKNPRLAKSLIGYVPQNYSFYEFLTVLEHAKLTMRLKQLKVDEVEEKLRAVDLWRVRNRKVRALSDGMKQRLGLGLALIGNPPLLLLDEPTSNVDLRGQVEFQVMIKRLLKEGKSMITTTHLTGLGELADEVMVLDKGQIITRGTPDILLGKTNAMDTIYLRVADEDRATIIEILNSFKAVDLESTGDWVTASVPSNEKIPMVKALISGGYDITDLMIERSKIESEYLKLIAPVDKK